MSRELPSPCPEDEYTFRGGLVGGKLDIAALLEEHLMPDGFDPDDIQALENLVGYLAPLTLRRVSLSCT